MPLMPLGVLTCLFPSLLLTVMEVLPQYRVLLERMGFHAAWEAEHAFWALPPPKERPSSAGSALRCATLGRGSTGKAPLTLFNVSKLIFVFSSAMLEFPLGEVELL